MLKVNIETENKFDIIIVSYHIVCERHSDGGWNAANAQADQWRRTVANEREHEKNGPQTMREY